MDKIRPESLDWQKKSQQNKKSYTRWLKSKEAKKSLKKLPDLHDEIFSQIDCLDCARCCKNISPRFKVPDISRISKHLDMKESVMIEKYLRVDEDGDFVVQHSPCPFLEEDHSCRIYEVRPRDCSRYPYTDSDQFVKRPQITVHNSVICPAVHLMLEKWIQE